jgi:hypothetical protein
MTVTVDDKNRVRLKDAKPGQRFDYTRDSEGRIILRRLKPNPETVESPLPRKRLVKGKDGRLYVAGGVPITNELVKKLLEDFP